MKKKKELKIGWWEKEWDRVFKNLLSEKAVEIGTHGITFNDYAKQVIKGILEKEVRELFDRHNLIAIAVEKGGHTNRHNIETVKKVVREFEYTKAESEKFIKQLKKLIT